MDWMFEDFKTDLDALIPVIREKAIEIAGHLHKEENYSKEKAISEGIKRAEEWYFNREA